MNGAATAVFEPLGKHHDRAVFTCGNSDIDAYLQNLATQDERRNLARVFVLVGKESSRIAGFHSLTNTRIDIGELPEGQARKLPHGRIIPGALIGQLARSLDQKGQDIGEILLIDALKRIVYANEISAVYAVVVDAMDEKAVVFYQRYGFIKFPKIHNRLFLPIGTARQLAL
ncbi:MAG: GNAT family N-acetyltransferase [Proteobacteria bacterium]|nr:GNAT family N-acetyltransferase [Pseudomonadota bacterium]